MKSGVQINRVDLIILLVIAVLVVAGIRIVIGFFRDGKKKKKE